MKNDINDIKTILQEEKERERTKDELVNLLIKYLYNIFDNDIRPDLLERGFVYFSYNDTRKEICNELASTQNEYNMLFTNYDKALKQVKSFFKEDMKRIDTIYKEQNQLQENNYKSNYIQKEKHKKTIFGVNPILAIILAPVVLFFSILDNTK